MFQYLLASTLFMVRAYAQSDGPQSLFNEDVFSKLRPCAQQCFFYPYASGVVKDEVGSRISCSLMTTLLSTVAENDCFCRTDLQLSVHLTISNCVMTLCSNSNDMTSAWSAYENYCTANGYVAAAAQPTGTTQFGGRTTAATVEGAPASGHTVTATQVAPGATSKPSSGSRVSVSWSIFFSGVVSVVIPSFILLV